MFSAYVGAENKISNIEIYSKGIMEVANTTFNTISETSTNEIAEVIETDGEDIKGKFNVNENIFTVTITTDNDTFELEGFRLEDEEMLLYKGSVDKEKNVKFEALVIKDGNNKHKAIVNILKFDSEIHKDPKDIITFSFNNHSKKVIKKTIELKI
ncbi:hypothetical protein [Bacillus weihaiensis]|uniref:Uncharacterized protein n=1 Tax=Bacillus weihaiensis TaxID=1547283 RepID=A0A1L3MMK3_9BACI|nr:hypothetical protein [Bacillus weihaiensis]APH03484.1 hypothetical protein A9C19_01210 [Bacillus weihaiensis]